MAIEIMVTSPARVEIRELAKQLALADPAVFAQFWFSFAEVVQEEKIDLREFGRVMVPPLGAKRQEPLRVIVAEMEAEIYRQRNETDPDQEVRRAAAQAS